MKNGTCLIYGNILVADKEGFYCLLKLTNETVNVIFLNICILYLSLLCQMSGRELNIFEFYMFQVATIK